MNKQEFQMSKVETANVFDENIEKQTEEKSEQAENTPEEKIKKVEDEISVKQQAIEGLRNRIAERKKALKKIREKIGLAPTEEITGCALDDVQELRQAHEDLEVLKNKLLDQVFSGIYGMERDTWKEKFTATLNKDMPANISSESVLREDSYLPENDMVDIGIQWHNNEEDDALAIDSHLMWFYKEKKLVIEKIRSENKQKGLGKLASKNIIELAKVIGAEKVALLAGEENGPYFWARMGFLPDAKGVEIYDWQGLSSTDYANKEHLRDLFLSFLKMHLANQNISQETYDSLQTSLNTKDDGSWLWDIVDSIDPMKQGDRTVPLGKGSWIPKYHGVFDLANTKQQKRLDDYTRQKNKSE